ncbi:pantoate--beta-alanine ligase [Parvularcula sp. IMCC14364]|uniref:pantoate--beta-alanine ligase n=1 Tax=Parvularcula sp. IMCC14364 TaxID=3067902 RepID=UPI002741519E|nr:pantoate--beta-alanine ligase [Parvularcula sp. IMCC14364]
MPAVSRSLEDLRMQVGTWRQQGLSIAFVPTMGALHAGHLSLVTLAAQKADRIVASIFVNPKQFAAHEDLDTYPRHEAQDLAKLAAAGCDLAFLPQATQMYPAGYTTAVTVENLSTDLCGVSRPHFFGGVATVVCKLLNQCQPDVAIFGEKDFQQLQVIKRMVRDLDMPVQIEGGPIIREADGLAMSSRNAYLTANERKSAGMLNVIMKNVITKARAGDSVEMALRQARESLLQEGFDTVDYLEMRREDDLSLISIDRLKAAEMDQARLFAAAIIGKTRLIDNMPLAPHPDHSDL